MLWKLRYPIVFKSLLPVRLLINLHLLIISDISVSLKDTFVTDVIRSINIDVSEVYVIVADELYTLQLPENFLDYCWWVGVQSFYNFRCVTLNTPSLQTLKCDFRAKQDLWNQINRFIHHDYY